MVTEWKDSPIARFQELYQPDDLNPLEYINGAIPVLRELGWFGQISSRDLALVQTILDNMHGDGLDEDNFPFGLLWGMVAAGALGTVPGLIAQLLDWREVCVTHQDYNLDYLPELS